jgi:hypothetical protein
VILVVLSDLTLQRTIRLSSLCSGGGSPLNANTLGRQLMGSRRGAFPPIESRPMEVLGPVWALIVVVPSGAIALLCAVTVIWKVRHPFRASGRLALVLRVILGLVLGAIVVVAVLLGGLFVATGRL